MSTRALASPSTALVFLLAAAACPSPPSFAEEGHCHMASEPAAAAAPAPAAGQLSELSLPDLELVDQDGHTVRVWSDLVAGRKVAMNFIFTTCTTICPPQGATFAKLQRELARDGGEPVQLISVSIDPAVDTPARLKAWRDKLGAGPGWTLLTGAKPQVDSLLKALGAFAAEKTEHAPLFLVGDGKSGRWQRLYGLPSPAELKAALAGLDAAAAPSPATAEEVGR